MAEEFSHTVMHGAVIRKQLPPGVNRPQPIKSSNAAGLFRQFIRSKVFQCDMVMTFVVWSYTVRFTSAILLRLNASEYTILKFVMAIFSFSQNLICSYKPSAK